MVYLFKSLFIFILFTLVFASSDCISQSKKVDKKLSSNIDFNALINSELEQSLIQVKSEQIVKFIKLSPKEKELIAEIKLLFKEGKECLKDADRVNEIDKIGERKIRRQENYELSFRYDAEELFEIANRLLFKIYETHYNTAKVLNSSQGSERQHISDLNNEAQELYKKAIISKEISHYNLCYVSGLDYLKKANYLIRESIKKYEQIFSIVYNIPVIKVENTLVIKSSNITPKVTELKAVKLVKTIETPIVALFGSETDIDVKSIKLNDMIVYKVQIGAFAQKVDINEFHGLVPLTEDKNQKLTKYMVGKYFSYKAATQAKKIIANTTKYKDAFVVAYKNDIRIIITNELLNQK